MSHSLTRAAGLVAAAIVIAPACSDSPFDVAEPTNLDPAPAVVDTFLQELPSWETFSPPLPASDAIIETPEGPRETREIVSGVTYDCISTPYSITQTPDRIVTLDPDANILWLGALLEGDGYKNGIGSLREWSVRERAPLEISIDILADRNTTRVTNPDLASVNQAIGQLIDRAEDQGHRSGSSLSFSQENTYSVNQGMLALGLSAGYASVSVKASISASRTAAERTVTAYFVQRMFTVSMVLPSTPRGLFSSQFTQARLNQEINRGHVGPDNVPVYVASVTYGRILMFSFTSTASITDIRASLAASFSSVAGGSIEGRYLDILNQATIKVVALGGEGRNASALIQSGQLAEYFEEEPALTSARPISYVVRNLGDNSIARVSETSTYDLRECTALPATGSMRVDVSPNDAKVFVSGPNNTTEGPSTGDLDLTSLPPGGYTISVSRTGYDSVSFDTSLVAGEHLDIPVTLQPFGTDPTGAFYTFRTTRLQMLNGSCTGETEADVYYSISVNGQNMESTAEGASVPLLNGQWINLSATFQDTIRTSISLSVNVHDADGALNAPDPMGSKSTSWNFPNIPEGNDLYVTMSNIAGCTVRLFFNITRGVNVTTAPPQPAGLIAALRQL